jgi:LTXXQ motif family protein
MRNTHGSRHGSKIAAIVGAIGLLFCLTAGTALAQGRGHFGGGGGAHPGGGGGAHPGGGGGAHPGGGGGAHPGGGRGGPHFGGGGGPHFGGGGGPHFGGGRGGPHFGGGRGGPHFGGVGPAPHFTTHFHVGRARGGAVGRSHVGIGHRGVTRFAGPHVGRFRGRKRAIGARSARLPRAHGHAGIRQPHVVAGRTGPIHARAVHLRGRAGPKIFAAHRRFAGDALFHRFLRRRHRHHHLGWIGPLFWPYAYGDFFYYALWPDEYAYYDPFWAYGYDDIYEGIFFPYSYQEYVRGPRALARMSELKRSVAQSCADEAAEVTGWPIDQIRDVVKPDKEQSALLDDLGNAVVKASDVIKSHCPTDVSFTPTGRLAEMQGRLEGLVQAVAIVQPPLAKFYDSLGDEQKARFNLMDAPEAKAAPRGEVSPSAQCGKSVMTWPTDRIDRELRPNQAQRGKLDALQAVAAKAADLIKAACPSEMPATPPDRLAAVGRRLQAMLKAVEIVQPALADFYNALSDGQKARFNALGRQLIAAIRG